MGRKLFVGNLGFLVTDSDLRELFQQYGTVESAQVITDRDTGRSRGFGFVEMAKEHEAEAAIEALNGQQMKGRSLTVNEARPKSEAGAGRAGGRGRFGGRRRVA
jgi:RNA recognition motif-containing protein